MKMTPDQLITMYHDERAEAKLGQQLFNIPRKNEDMIEAQVFYYYVGDRRRVAVDFKREICFHLNYIRSKPMTPEQYLIFQESTTPMEDLIRAEIIHPFLLFISGYMIPWENITIIASKERYDLLVKGLTEEFFDKINGADGIVESAYVIDLPDGISYSQGGYPIDPQRTMFVFNEEGEMVFDREGEGYIVIDDVEDVVDKIDFQDPPEVFQFADDPMYKYFPENFITFVDGKYDPNFDFKILATSAKVIKLEGGGGITVHAEDDTSNNLPDQTEDNTEEDRPLPEEPPVETDPEDPGSEPSETPETPEEPLPPEEETDPTVHVSIRIFHNRKLCTPTYDNIRKVSLAATQEDIKKTLAGDTGITYMQYLQESFDPKLDIKKDYLENKSNFLDYLAYYDSMLFNRVYRDDKEVIDLEVDYWWVMGHTTEDQLMRVPRRFQDGINYFIIVMVNGELIGSYQSSFYRFGYYFCPINGMIKEDDVIELLYFKHAKNFEIQTVISKEEKFLSLDKWIYGDDLQVFCKETNDEYFKFPADGDQNFPVPFHLEYNDSRKRNLRIRFENEYYYGKQVTLTSRKRFIYYHANLQVPPESTGYKYFTVDLGEKFKFCNEYDRYMVFLNGKRLMNDLFRLVLPYRTTTPFSKAMIYLCVPIHDGDRIEIFYLPNHFLDIYDGVFANPSIDEFAVRINGSRYVFRNVSEYKIRKELLESLSDPESVPPDFDAMMADGTLVHFSFRGHDMTDRTVDLTLHMPLNDTIIPLQYRGTDIEWGSQPHHLDETGLIRVEKDKLQFALDNDLCTVWVNARKLPPSWIKNVNATTMQIVHDLTSTRDVRITVMMSKDDVVPDYSNRFGAIDSLWDKACKEYGDPSELMGIERPVITNTDPEAFPEKIPTIAVMHEIIRDWYVASGAVDTSKPFIYDYLDVDASDVIGKDSAGNRLLGAMDSNRTDNLDVKRPWP